VSVKRIARPPPYVMRLTVWAIGRTHDGGRVIDEQRMNQLHVDSRIARAIGDSHEYDLLDG